MRARTAQAKQIQGLLGEFGLVVPQGITYIAQRVPALIEDAENELPATFRLLVQRLLDHLKALQEQVDAIEVQIKAWHRASEASQRIETVPGIGPLTASALVASVGDVKDFDNGRQFSAWLGLVPRQRWGSSRRRSTQGVGTANQDLTCHFTQCSRVERLRAGRTWGMPSQGDDGACVGLANW